MPTGSKVSGYLYVGVAAVIWGSNGVIVNWVPLNPYPIAFFRVLFATVTLLPIVVVTQRSEFVKAGQAWRSMLTLGVMLSFGWGLLFQSMKLIPIASAVFLNYMAPIFAALLAPIILKERLKRSSLFALALSVTGVFMISSPHTLQTGSLNLAGILFGLSAGLAYAGFIILSKRTVVNFSSRIVAFYSYSTAMICLSPFLLEADLGMNLSSWILLTLLGVLNTGFAVTLYLKGLGLIEVQKAVVFTYLEPLSAVALGFLLLCQQPTVLALIGGFLILIAGYTVASQ